jgi:DNA-binding transcriptional LysR family regulator
MDFRQLQCFCAVAEKRSFTLAAQALQLSQPSVSFQIASLEQELGTSLFDRQGRQTVITPSGETLYGYARKILKLCDEADQAIKELGGLLRGRISLGASNIPGEYILPDLLLGFRKEYPGLQVELVVGDTKDTLDRILSNELELGVVGATHRSSKLVFLPFVTDKLALVASPDNEWFSGDAATLEELRETPFIQREVGSGTRKSVAQRLQEMGLAENELATVMILGSTTAVKRAVEGGAGVSILSEKAVEREMSLGLLKRIELKGTDMHRDFFIVHRSRGTLAPAVRALLEYLQREKGSL